jgi:ELWxxDGT repeat protein
MLTDWRRLIRPAAFATLLAVALVIPGVPAAAVVEASTPYLVRDINSSGGSNPRFLANVGGTAFFSASGRGGRELWKSNGTGDGTIRVRNIRPGTAGSGPQGLMNHGGTLFFSANDGAHGRELWKSDGTGAGTKLVRDIRFGQAGSLPRALTHVGSTLFFNADDGIHGRELWVSDGTAPGTRMVEDLGTAQAVAFTSFQGKVWFGRSPCGPSSCDTSLWVSDGTAAGTMAVLKPNGFPIIVKSELIKAGPRLVGTEYQNLWSTDGVCSGIETCTTTDYLEIGEYHPAGLERLGEIAYFQGWTPDVHGMPVQAGLWSTDGTVLGTALVEEVGLAGNDPRQITRVGDRLFFTVDFGSELWTSDGSTDGTEQLITGVAAPGAKGLTAVGDDLYFTVPGELWTSDGSVTGTTLIADIDTTGGTTPGELTAVAGTLYLAADDGTHGTELWRYVP